MPTPLFQRIFNISSMQCNTLVALALWGAAASSQAATITVEADSDYFSDWVFTDIQRPDGGTARVYLEPGQRAPGTLHNRSFEIYAEPWPGGSPCYGNSSGDPIPEMCFGYTPSWFMGYDLPANIGAPSRVSDINLRQGHGTIAFSRPVPAGTTFFFQDVDNPETARVYFQSCTGANLDASGADVLLVSTVNTPSISLEGTAPDTHWYIQHNNNSDNFSVNGLVIQRDDVCRIHIEGWRNNNVGGGSIRYFVGAPLAALTAQDAAAALARPVPLNAWWMLLASMLGIAGLAIRYRKTVG